MNEVNKMLLEQNDSDIDDIIQDQNTLNLNYEKLKQDINAIKDKNTILWINRSHYLLNKLEGDTFDGFYQLIDLDLSYNTLTCLPRGVFDQLLILQTINLSHNLISQLEDSLFKNNKHLRIINFSNNFLTKINTLTFDNLSLLQKLDFSYNIIEILPEICIKSKSLNELNLNNNLINDIHKMAFWFVPNLILLQLNNNKISYLDETIFKKVTKIEILNFSHNLIQKLNRKTFAKLYNLKQVNFSNNLLLTCGNCFKSKPMLRELNLLNNQLMNLKTKNFGISENIRTLKLTIHRPHILKLLSNLELLSDFELHVKSETKFPLIYYVLPWINVSIIQRLYMVIQKGTFSVNIDISDLLNIEFLHIQFLEPIIQLLKFDILYHINVMSKLKHLALININKLKIKGKKKLNQNNLIYMNLTGIYNISANFLRYKFITLEHLNLSASKIKTISQVLMSSIPFIKFLNMNNTQISVIEDYLFWRNIKLEVILFKDCQIHTIGNNAFGNSKNLKKIDIRGNTQLRITQNLLNEIPKSAVVYHD